MRDRRRGREERENIQLTLHLCTRGFQQSERIVEMSGYGCETKGRPQETSTWPVTHLPSFILPSALLFSSSLPPPSPHTRHQGPGDSHYLLARSVIHLCTQTLAQPTSTTNRSLTMHRHGNNRYAQIVHANAPHLIWLYPLTRRRKIQTSRKSWPNAIVYPKHCVNFLSPKVQVRYIRPITFINTIIINANQPKLC